MRTSFITDSLQQLADQGRYRSLREVSSSQGREIVLNGQRVLNFCSNNYLGLADDERIKQAAIKAIESDGFGSGASRLVCGNMSAHEALENELAALKKTESCLVFSSGYMANTGVISALVGRDDIVFSDKLNHASIVDGIILSRAQMKRYTHLDMQSLEDGLKAAPAHHKKLIVTDSVFSMDGDVAPLKEIVGLARRYDAMVMVDEAHGFGVLGPNGAGLVEELGLTDEIDVHMGTLSKAAGCFGAYVCGTKQLREYLINHSRSFIYTTAMPPALAQAAREAIAIIKSEPQLRKNLKTNVEYLRASLKELVDATNSLQTPIIPIILKSDERALQASRKLLEAGVFVQAIRPPTVPPNTARLRVTLMATHTTADIDQLIEALRKI